MKHPNLLKALEIKEKAAVLPTAVCIGDASVMNLELLLSQSIIWRQWVCMKKLKEIMLYLCNYYKLMTIIFLFVPKFIFGQ